MIYLGGSWPAEYRGELFMNNIHGARLNVDRLTPSGSGYVGDAAPDFLKANDLWSQILYLRYGPDGQVYMIDWYDRNQCHHGNWAGHDRSNGRIFKISYKNAKPIRVNLANKSDAELVALLLHNNDWYVRQARRLLHERDGQEARRESAAVLAEMAFQHKDVSRRLRGLWALHVTGGLDEDQIQRGLKNDSDLVRSWTVQLALEDGKPTADTLQRLTVLAQGRVAGGAALPRVGLAASAARKTLGRPDGTAESRDGRQRPQSAADVLVCRRAAGGAGQRSSPEAGGGRQGAAAAAVHGAPRRLGGGTATAGTAGQGTGRGCSCGQAVAVPARHSGGPRRPAAGADAEELRGVYEKLSGSPDAEVRGRARALAVTFGDPAALVKMRQLLALTKTPPGERKQFLAVLLAARDRELVPVLRELLKEPGLRADALRGLAAYDDPKTPAAILGVYPSLTYAEKRDALGTLTSRVPYARELLAAVGAKKVPATDLTADLIRQLRNLKNTDVDRQIAAVWGTVRETSADKARLIARYKALLAVRPAPTEALPRGRALFAKTCQQCHTLFGVGGKIGPELTGSNRADLDYLLSNILDPSAVVGKDYLTSVVETKKGRVLTGILARADQERCDAGNGDRNGDRAAHRGRVDQNEQPVDDAGRFAQVVVRRRRGALAGYLASPRQVPLLATPDNVQTFFNGKDLSGWDGDPKLWKVEEGEIVGRSPGLKRNEFLIGHLLAGDFRLTCQVKLTPNAGNSGIQFRSAALPGGEVKGYQADVGAGWWGKLYEEHGRGLLAKDGGEVHVKPGAWNRYEVVAVGSRIRLSINGKRCADVTDPSAARRGIFALQLHSGGPFEVRFKDLKLELNPRLAP